MNVLTTWSTDRIRRMSPDQLDWLLGQVMATARSFPEDTICVSFGAQGIEVTRAVQRQERVALQLYVYSE